MGLLLSVCDRIAHTGRSVLLFTQAFQWGIKLGADARQTLYALSLKILLRCAQAVYF
jgi:hypothetical protein